ncbi:MAG: glycosyltransferase family 2 protein [Patescibacteria group bacterium]
MDFSVIIPAYNEADNLKLLVPKLDARLRNIGRTYEVIVVDNASTDATQEVIGSLRAGLPALRLVYEGKKGFGNALLTGFNAAQGEVIGYIHADNQMEPDDLVKVYEKLKRDGLNVCKATRLDRHDGFTRLVISKCYNLLFRLMFGVKLLDINGSPKLFTRDFYNRVKLESRDWFIDPEIVIKASRLGVPMGEVGIHTKPRPHGASQVRFQTLLEFFKNMIHYWRQ